MMRSTTTTSQVLFVFIASVLLSITFQLHARFTIMDTITSTPSTFSLPSDFSSTNKLVVQNDTISSSPSHNGRNDTKLSNVAIFLNAFFPENVDLALSIVRDQLTQISNSFASSTPNLQIYIKPVTRGNLSAIPLTGLCPHYYTSNTSNTSSDCTILDGKENGGELDTLNELYDFCTNPTTPNTARAVYMHNKGSFHPSKYNKYWRRSMTAAVTSSYCLQPPNETCNACGLLFSSPPRMFTNLFPGNFFAVSCDYVRRLSSPLHGFVEKHRDLARHAVNQLRMKRLLTFTNNDDKPWVLGTERYTAEHWIGSHPSIRPCDLSKSPTYYYWSERKRSQKQFEFQMFPRHPPTPLDPSMVNSTNARIRKYPYFAGHLLRFTEHYGTVPPIDSWMYEQYPDGTFWKAAVQKFGLKTFDVIIRRRHQLTDEFVSELSSSI